MHAAKTDWEALQRILIMRVSTSSVSIDPESTALSDCGNQACLFRKTRLATFASIQQSIAARLGDFSLDFVCARPLPARLLSRFPL